jgi:phosphate:Na+ symporter
VWLEALQIIGEMLAGLALFFFGIQRLSSQLRQITGRNFRMLLQRATRSPLLSALAGALLGATMQTGSAITFILVSMVGAGMIMQNWEGSGMQATAAARKCVPSGNE